MSGRRERALVYAGYREGRDRAFDFMRDDRAPRCRIGSPSVFRDLPGGRLHMAMMRLQRCILPASHAGWCRFEDERAIVVTSDDGPESCTYHDLIERRDLA